MQITKLSKSFKLTAFAAVTSLTLVGCSYGHSATNTSTAPVTTTTVQATEVSKVPNGMNSALLASLRQGGHVIYIRHATTESDYADQVKADPNDCSTQRVLSEMGWNQAKKIGQSFKALNIPVGKVYSSQYCRAWQTADLAFGRYEKMASLNFLPSEDYTEEQVRQMAMAVQPMLSASPQAGTNTVIVAHDDPFEAATGIYPEPQGVAYVARPMSNGKFALLARIDSDSWMP